MADGVRVETPCTFCGRTRRTEVVYDRLRDCLDVRQHHVDRNASQTLSREVLTHSNGAVR